MKGYLQWGLQPARLCPRVARSAAPPAQAARQSAVPSKTMLSSQLKVCFCQVLHSAVLSAGVQVLMTGVQLWVSRQAAHGTYVNWLSFLSAAVVHLRQPQLQQQLAALGLDKEGTRAELVERLHAAQAARSPAAAQDIPSRSSLKTRRKVRMRPGL